MKVLLFVFCFVVFVSLSTSHTHHTRWFQLDDTYSFEKYVSEFSKQYSSQNEYTARKQIFQQNLAKIWHHNSDPSFTWKQGVNHLTDLSEKEFKQLLGYRKELAYTSSTRQRKTTNQFDSLKASSYPDSIDWRMKDVISPVKDQGMCGSCWTFGTTETIESYWALKTGQLDILSEQQALDCTPNPKHCGGTGGCNGGTPELIYQQLLNTTGGLASEWTYPYVSYFGQDFKCNSKISVAASISDYKVLPTNIYDPVIAALQEGPLTINVEASYWAPYEEGVFNGCNQTNPDINHVVQLVGYGTDPKLGDYWLVRNSWSPVWGEDGYIRLARANNTECGVDITPLDGTGCDGGPANVTVCGTCGILFDVSFPVVKVN